MLYFVDFIHLIYSNIINIQDYQNNNISITSEN